MWDSFDWLNERYGAQRHLTLSFGEKRDFVPLQAADILAYEGNKRLRVPENPERKAWKALNTDKPKIWAMHYGKRNMPALLENLEKIHASIARGEVTFMKEKGVPRGRR